MKHEQAETLGLQALGWLMGNDELCPVFLGATGAALADVRAGASDPAFLASVIEFLTMDDQWIVEMCDTLGWSYDTPMTVRQTLSGPELHWT